MKYILSVFITLCFFAATAQAKSTFYLVRHAEKQHDGTRDPALTKDGEKRARAIAAKLKDVPLKGVYATSYKRTRMTAAPTATQAGVPVEIYDARDIAGFAKKLGPQEGSYLIVGHSNTTPSLASTLSGKKVEPLKEDQFDRFFKITVGDDGKATLKIMYTEPRTP